MHYGTECIITHLHSCSNWMSSETTLLRTFEAPELALESKIQESNKEGSTYSREAVRMIESASIPISARSSLDKVGTVGFSWPLRVVRSSITSRQFQLPHELYSNPQSHQQHRHRHQNKRQT